MKYLKYIAGIVVVVAIAGAYLFPVASKSFGAAAPANSTNGNQLQLYINGWNLANSTSTSVQNTTGFDVSAQNFQYVCSGVGNSFTAYTGAGLASVTLKAATTSTSNVGNTSTSNTAVANTNLIVSTTLATSSPNTLVSSSTPSIAGNSPINDIIPNGSYVTFFTNATSSAVCNIGVEII